MGWTVTHTSGTTTTDITAFVRLNELSASLSGTPIEQALAFTLYTKGAAFKPVENAMVLVKDAGGYNKFRGWISSIERTDAPGAQVAGITGAESYNVVASSILARLKATQVPFATTTAQQRAQELPKGLRQNESGAYLDTHPMRPKAVLAWALNLIEDLEAAKGGARMPALSLVTTNIVNPAPNVSTPSGLKDFYFTSPFAFFADGATYYELIDNICQLSALRWWIDADLRLHTMDAVAPTILGVEIADADAEGGTVAVPLPHVSGSTVLTARSISLTTDIASIVNAVVATYNTKTEVKSVTQKNASSIASYGERWETINTNFGTAAMARAIAWRRVNTAKTPDYRGSARVRFDADSNTIAPGYRMWVSQVRHGKAQLVNVWGVRPVFEPGSSVPVWLDVEFSRADWRPPSFTPVVFPPKAPPPPPKKPIAPANGYDGKGTWYIAPLAYRTAGWTTSAPLRSVFHADNPHTLPGTGKKGVRIYGPDQLRGASWANILPINVALGLPKTATEAIGTSPVLFELATPWFYGARPTIKQCRVTYTVQSTEADKTGNRAIALASRTYPYQPFQFDNNGYAYLTFSGFTDPTSTNANAQVARDADLWWRRYSPRHYSRSRRIALAAGTYPQQVVQDVPLVMSTSALTTGFYGAWIGVETSEHWSQPTRTYSHVSVGQLRDGESLGLKWRSLLADGSNVAAGTLILIDNAHPDHGWVGGTTSGTYKQLAFDVSDPESCVGFGFGLIQTDGSTDEPDPGTVLFRPLSGSIYTFPVPADPDSVRIFVAGPLGTPDGGGSSEGFTLELNDDGNAVSLVLSFAPGKWPRWVQFEVA